MGDIFTTCFCSKGPSSGSTEIKITVTSYWHMIGLYINENSYLQLNGL